MIAISSLQRRGQSLAIGEDRCRCRFDRRQRRLEFVRNGIQQRRLELLALPRHLGPRRRLLRPHPLQRDRHQIQQRLQRAIRQLHPPRRQAPDRLPSQRDRRHPQPGLGFVQARPLQHHLFELCFNVRQVLRAAPIQLSAGCVVQRDRVAFENLGDRLRHLQTQRPACIAQQDGPAQRIQLLRFSLPLARVQRLLFRAVRQVARH
jgi:hypothetical protein